MQIKTIITYVLFSLTILFHSCIDEYWPDLGKQEEVMVVDGLITDAEGPHIIKLSISAPVENPEYIPMTDASVRVEDKSGHIHYFSELDSGKYVCNNLDANAGNSYKLFINTEDGDRYESDFQELTSCPAIDSITYDVEYQPTTDVNYDRAGYRFYASTRDVENNHPFYLWRLEETYEYHAGFIAYYIFAGSLEDNPEPYKYYYCWKSQTLDDYYMYDARHLEKTIINKIPLNYVSTEGKHLTVKYSLLVRQYAISEEAFNYYSNIKNQQTEGDNLYTKQPFYVQGNLRCMSDPDKKVLGYFLVAGQSRRRIFVDRPYLPFYDPECEASTDGIGYLFLSPPEDWPIYFTKTATGSIARSSPECFDCRTYGGKLEKPAFWPDDE